MTTAHGTVRHAMRLLIQVSIAPADLAPALLLTVHGMLNPSAVLQLVSVLSGMRSLIAEGHAGRSRLLSSLHAHMFILQAFKFMPVASLQLGFLLRPSCVDLTLGPGQLLLQSMNAPTSHAWQNML